jgi:hypothetical protein
MWPIAAACVLLGLAGYYVEKRRNKPVAKPKGDVPLVHLFFMRYRFRVSSFCIIGVSGIPA